jgi:GNAT superfamily N-acetyltransferase
MFNATMYRALGSNPSGPSRLSPNSSIRLTDDGSLPDWQRTVAAAHNLTTSTQREMSDAFAAAAFVSPGETMYLLSNPSGPVATASLTLIDGLAILGGMATVPSARRQGVQQALIRRRLGDAFTFGADLAVTTAASGRSSQRNLLRAGFQVAYTQVLLSQS